MKTVLILVVSSQLSPYKKMWQTSKETWDSIEVSGVETVFYFGQPFKENTDKEIYFDIPEGYSNMGYKLTSAFEWSLANKSFDYIARVNSSTYVHKKELLSSVQSMPDSNLFAGLKVVGGEKEWIWGGGSFLISRDVVEKIVANKLKFNHKVMEDNGLSEIVAKIGIPFTDGRACSIDKMEHGWRCLCYGTESFDFFDFSEMVKLKGQYFVRCKQDYNRDADEMVMKELLKYLA